MNKQLSHFYAVSQNRGAAMLLLALLFVVGSTLLVSSMSKTVYTDAVAYNRLQDTKQNTLTADSGMEDVVYRLRQNKVVDGTEVLALSGATTTTIHTDVSGAVEVSTSATTTSRNRKRQIILTPGGIGVSFNYGVQVGTGGMEMSGNASIEGNIYSNGPISGPTGGGSLGTVDGDAVSAGSSGLINKIETSGSAYAHTITDSEISIDAYYQTKSGTTVGGTNYPGSIDQPVAPFPITDAMLDEIEAVAVAGGTMSCASYTIHNIAVSLGPIKIDCDVVIDGSSVVTLTGPVWVTGSVTIRNTARINLSPILGSVSGVIIADVPTNRLTKGTFSVGNGTTFAGRVSPPGSIFLISRNTSAENSGSLDAISMGNNNAAGDVVLYAPHGQITVGNSAELVQVTGYKIRIQNNATLIYTEGLASTLFTGGPGSGFRILSWDTTP